MDEVNAMTQIQTIAWIRNAVVYKHHGDEIASLFTNVLNIEEMTAIDVLLEDGHGNLTLAALRGVLIEARYMFDNGIAPVVGSPQETLIGMYAFVEGGLE